MPSRARLRGVFVVFRRERRRVDSLLAEQFTIRSGNVRHDIAKVADVPLMFGGAARFQRENILAAVSVAFVQGMPVEQIRATLG